MGAAQSSNVSQAVTNVSNFVSNSTTANTDQVSQVAEQVEINNCTIQLSGDFNVNSSSKLMETNNQIVSAKQDANLNNNIQQQMLQEATSKVGFLGIGYASASNSANEMVNSTTQITNDINASANQYSNIGESFTCDRSTIIADNLNIGFYSNSDFLSSQTLNNTQTATIVNSITQKVTQKATATVEGIAGLILALLLILAVIIYAIGKPLSTGSAKVAVGGGLAFALAGIISFMYIRNTSPFFSKPSNCINHSAIGMGTGADIPDCIEMSNKQIDLDSPPTKYIYAVIPGGASQSGGNLVQMAIAQISGQSKSGAGPNGGYRIDTMINLAAKIAKYQQYADLIGIPNIPNPLYDPGVVVPTGDSNNPYYGIPDLFIPNEGGQQGSSGSICTPGTASVGPVDKNTKISFIDCYANKDGLVPSPYGSFSYPANLWGSDGFTNVPFNGVANLNMDNMKPGSWLDYINLQGIYGPSASYKGYDEKTDRILFARFVLCDIIGNIDLHHWVSPNEIIKFISDKNVVTIGVAATQKTPDSEPVPNYPNDTYFYHPDSVDKWEDGLQGTGYIQGQVGVLNDRQYKFEKFMKKIGIWIIVGILVLTLGYMFYSHKQNKKEESKPNK